VAWRRGRSAEASLLGPTVHLDERPLIGRSELTISGSSVRQVMGSQPAKRPGGGIKVQVPLEVKLRVDPNIEARDTEGIGLADKQR
jgi:hypothetical protein